jgi:aminoglycoside phosphotransferase (APT) family kinase protein
LPRLPGELVARGTRSTVHAYGRGAVVKVPAASTVDGWISSEAQFAEAARSAGAPVPRLLGLEQIDDRTASVWERVEGASVWQHVVDRPASGADLGRAVADVQLALFELVAPVTLPAQRDRLVTKIRRAAATIDPALAGALELLPAPPGALHLCHGDLHPSNVILSPHGPMVVDWFDASRGEPVADVARSWLLLLGDGKHPPRHLPGADAATLATLTSAYVARLGERLELDGHAFACWQAVNAVARMAEGVPRGLLIDVWTRFGVAGRPYAAAG